MRRRRRRPCRSRRPRRPPHPPGLQRIVDGRVDVVPAEGALVLVLAGWSDDGGEQQSCEVTAEPGLMLPRIAADGHDVAALWPPP